MALISKRVNPYLFIFLLIAFFLIPTIGFAATIRVPSEQATIQAGIDAAVAGDTVLVADGTYTGEGNKNIDFKGKAITVQSENGAENCIVDCESLGRGFYFHNKEGPSSILFGFTIKGGFAFEDNNEGGGGIYLFRSSPSITYCTITLNSGGGICSNYSFPKISSCIISKNTADYGGGIHLFYSSPTIINCTIKDNTGYNTGGGIRCYESSPSIMNSAITENTVHGDGGGIYCGCSSSPAITKCNISENEAYNNGGGIYCGYGNISSSPSPDILGSIIRNNIARVNGGGIYAYYCYSRIINCIIAENKAFQGGGIFGFYSNSLKIINCTIAGNNANAYGGGIKADAYDVLTNSIFWKNTPDSIYGDPTTTYSDIEGGYAGEGNIQSNPEFVSETDYRLSASSPCIDTGTSNGTPNTDINGNPRPQGNGYDMGAYESDQSGGARPTVNAGSDQQVFNSIKLDGSASTAPSGSITTYSWALKYQGNSSYDRTATGVSPTVSTLQPGFYDVTLTVTDNQGLTNTDTMLFSAMGINCDFNGDGDVDGSDLQVFSTNYGK